jgi:hypothetical protein
MTLRFEVFMAVSITIMAFWVGIPWSLVHRCQCFGELCWFHPQVEQDMEMEAVGYFETFKPVSLATWCHIQQACYLNPPEGLMATFR